jgi:hypothetical protein
VSPVKSNAFVLHFPIFKANDLLGRICPAIGVIWTIRSALFSAFVALYRAHHADCAMLTVSPVKTNAFVQHFPIFKANDLIGRISPAIGVM